METAACPLKIRIRQHTFTLPRRYSAGHVLTAGEAQALNQVFSENVRNNVDGWVNNELEASSSSFLSQEQQDSLQTRITEYATNYQFMVRTRTHSPTSLENVVSNLALQQAMAEGRRSGLSRESPEVRLRYLTLVRDPSIRQQAQEYLLAQQALAKMTIKDLL